MAIYHFNASMVSRSKGHSVVQVAASRSGTKLYDETTGRTKRPARRDGPVWSAVLLVKGAPSQWSDRLVLWNAVELRERYKNAALAREIRVALPAELPVGACIELARSYAEEVFVQSGMVVDLNVWPDRSAEGEPRPWASLLMTTRQVTPAGFGLKNTDWNDRALLRTWRARWAAYGNDALARHGFPATLDHRSNYERGIDFEPQIKIGQFAARRSRAGEVMERVVENEGIVSRNKARRQAALGAVGAAE